MRGGRRGEVRNTSVVTLRDALWVDAFGAALSAVRRWKVRLSWQRDFAAVRHLVSRDKWYADCHHPRAVVQLAFAFRAVAALASTSSGMRSPCAPLGGARRRPPPPDGSRYSVTGGKRVQLIPPEQPRRSTTAPFGPNEIAAHLERLVYRLTRPLLLFRSTYSLERSWEEERL
ncbi:hypothetical protein HPB51_009571 [Rhipicephalus microplus]|uniref:Uncharacterized protein n=1 Tax=Rhipicephalus microplus TaxID=6941 RepID=A0A9J6D8W9_RHIMP|nr:hypothetical protein HPB51_009571 [Rhipicephalus microplus]